MISQMSLYRILGINSRELRIYRIMDRVKTANSPVYFSIYRIMDRVKAAKALSILAFTAKWTG